MKSLQKQALLLLVAATLVTLFAAAFALQRAAAPSRLPAAPQTMASMLPQGALLTIESPDFAALLHAWSSSPQSAAWLHSANYSVFSNSRLFGRLADAQSQFASTAAFDAAGTSFLNEVAGHQSIFAWYDVGNLEFLYITRMPAARAAQTRLLQSQSRFSRRQAGASVFYVRTQPGNGTTPKRTVAYATSGDLLLLATREDLMANALQLLTAFNPAPASLAQEPWYTDALAAVAATATTPDLHMVLNLDRIVPLPYFRTYWVQRNITDMTQYRSAVADLYRESTSSGPAFREERTLLLKAAESTAADPDLAPLAALVPPATGIFRASATSDPVDALTALNEKLLGQSVSASRIQTAAPEPTLEPTSEGSTSDLETRIDTPTPVKESASTQALAQTFKSSGLNALLTLDSAALPEPPQSSLYIPIHSAVVVRTDRPMAPAAFESALQQALRGSLTTAKLGLEFQPVPSNPRILTLTGPKALFLSFSGSLVLISNDQPFLDQILARLSAATQAPAAPATLIAGFDHPSQRASYARLTTLVDSSNRDFSNQTSPTPPAANDSPASAPPFFSGNIRSLSDAFAALQTERILTRHQGEALHQTVLYQWQP